MQNDDDRRQRADQDYWHRQQARRSEQNRGYGDDRSQEEPRSGERERGRDRYAEGYGEQRYDDPSWREWQPSQSEEWRTRQDARGSERYSPDWSRRESEPLYSGDPYYSRNRRFNERDERDDYRSRAGGERSDESRRFSGEGGERGRSSQAGTSLQRDSERDRENERYYRGYYGRSWTPYRYPGGRGDLFVESWVLTGPHTGRGPKGYKRSDQQIIEDACQRLERDGHIDASDIEVTAEDGVIELRGSVTDRETKRRAEECVESVYGAHDVMNHLRVRREESRQSASSSQSSTGKTARGSGAGARTSGSESDDHGMTRSAAAEQEKKKSGASKEQHN